MKFEPRKITIKFIDPDDKHIKTKEIMVYTPNMIHGWDGIDIANRIIYIEKLFRTLKEIELNGSDLEKIEAEEQKNNLYSQLYRYISEKVLVNYYPDFDFSNGSINYIHVAKAYIEEYAKFKEDFLTDSPNINIQSE